MRKIIRAVVACAFFASFLLSSVGIKAAQTNASEKSISSANKGADLLVLKHAKEIFSKKKDNSLKLAWHESHSSHSSHESHYSHYSGD